jgi:PKHD-type hydroxylase
VDNILRHDESTRPPTLMRADLSATLFLSDPADYDGGELIIQGGFGAQSVKLGAGDLVLYPATSVHRVEPVTRGERLACVLWLQSMVREESQRSILFDLDLCIRRLRADHPQASTIELLGIYNNLVQRWTEV